MPKTTFQGVVRSGGGDTRKIVTPAVVQVVVPFHMADPTAANTTVLTVSSDSGAPEVVLPPSAIVTELHVSADATGGTTPTFDMGWIGYSDTSELDVDGLIAEGDADAGDSVFNMATATAGDDVGTTMTTTQAVKITGGVGASVATGGTISGYIVYHVQDNGVWL